VRRWDLAASMPVPGRDPDWTVGLLMSRYEGKWYVEDVKRFRESAHQVRRRMKATAEADGPDVNISLPQDPGQAGKDQAESLIAMLADFVARAERETGSKETRAEPFSAQCEGGNVYVLDADWTEEFIDELCNFPVGHDDQVDAGAGAFLELIGDDIQGVQIDTVSLHRDNPMRIDLGGNT
jgi:predicted phage terminase large subunit-like protein